MNDSDDSLHPTEPEIPPQTETPEPPRARRRRAARQQMIPAGAEGHATLVAALARRSYPSYELFIFSLLCGVTLGLGYLLDSQAVLLFGILVAPLMTPWVGLLLSIFTGSLRFFFVTAMALLISAAIVFFSAALIGFAARFALPPITLTNAFLHSHLWRPELAVIVTGAVTLVASFVRSESKPFLPSVIVAYAFFLPISAAGLGLGIDVPGIWPNGALVALVHLELACLFGLLTLFLMRLRPSLGGTFFSAITGMVIVATLFFLMGTDFPSVTLMTEIPTPIQTPLSSSTFSLPAVSTDTSSPNPSSTPVIETETPAPTPTPVPLTLNVTLPPTESPTITLTIQPTPVYGRISASEGGGVFLRKTPNGEYIATLDNGVIVEIQPEVQEVNGVAWVHVIVTRYGVRLDGWILQSAVTYPTPAADWLPSQTPTATSTP